MNNKLQYEWAAVLDKTITMCQDDEQFHQYSVREKMLALVYTFLQNMQEQETHFLEMLHQHNGIKRLDTSYLKDLKSGFESYVNGLVEEGRNSGEIQGRPFLARFYMPVLWNAFVNILYFWANDKSPQREHTDVMVEKTVHFTFDLLAPNAIDSGIDLVQQYLKLKQ